MFNQIAILCLCVLFAACQRASAFESWFKFRHHNNFELNQILQTVVSRCPQIASIYELSERSVYGWPLTVIEFSNKPGQHQLCKCFLITFIDWLLNSIHYFTFKSNSKTRIQICRQHTRKWSVGPWNVTHTCGLLVWRIS